MASETQIYANRRKAQVMVLSFLRRQEPKVLVGPGFRIKCGMTAQKVPTKSCAFMQNEPNFGKAQMNVNKVLTKDYENKPNWTLGENEPNQSQFSKSQMNVNLYNTTYYENKSNWTLGENKPNSNPIKPNLRKAKMNVNSLITKDYRK